MKNGGGSAKQFFFVGIPYGRSYLFLTAAPFIFIPYFTPLQKRSWLYFRIRSSWTAARKLPRCRQESAFCGLWRQGKMKGGVRYVKNISKRKAFGAKGLNFIGKNQSPSPWCRVRLQCRFLVIWGPVSFFIICEIVS